MIQIAHEAPLSIMGKVQHMTDYDYALVHLFEDQTIGGRYLAYFDGALLKGREVILDNSVFELGQAFDMNRFRSWVERLKPTYYIIPDKLRDAEETMAIISNWAPIKGSKSIGVVQGLTLDDCIRCYLHIAKHCDKIAFPFNLPLYNSYAVGENQARVFMKGRWGFIHELIDRGLINNKKPHHLLGTMLPQDVAQYRDEKFSFIESIDTSNPVVHGMFGIRYTETGLAEKIENKLYTMISATPTPEQWAHIKYNIKAYREFAGNPPLK